MLRSFIKGSRLRQWLAKENCPPAIREAKKLFDKMYGTRQDTEDGDVEFKSKDCPDDLRPLMNHYKLDLARRIKYQGVFFSDYLTHKGNSQIMFYPLGNAHKLCPGRIKYIFSSGGCISVAIQRQLPTHPTILDPFRFFPYFPASIYSNTYASTLEVVLLDRVVSHFASYALSTDLCAVLNLSRVCLSFAI